MKLIKWKRHSFGIIGQACKFFSFTINQNIELLTSNQQGVYKSPTVSLGQYITIEKAKAAAETHLKNFLRDLGVFAIRGEGKPPEDVYFLLVNEHKVITS